MNLHQFYFEVWTRAREKSERIGQALFNQLNVRRPELADKLRATEIDPFFSSSPTDSRYDGAIKFIEANWFIKSVCSLQGESV